MHVTVAMQSSRAKAGDLALEHKRYELLGCERGSWQSERREDVSVISCWYEAPSKAEKCRVHVIAR